MSDEAEPEIPEIFNIPSGVIQGWLDIPSTENVSVTLTRHDLDNLYFSISHLVNANAALQQCLISYSNGELESANRWMKESQKANVSGLNSVRWLFNAIMANVARSRKS